jgi:hypothetical protein
VLRVGKGGWEELRVGKGGWEGLKVKGGKGGMGYG